MYVYIYIYIYTHISPGACHQAAAAGFCRGAGAAGPPGESGIQCIEYYYYYYYYY